MRQKGWYLMKTPKRDEEMRRIRFELAAFGKGGIFNRKEPAVKQRIIDLEMQLAELETESMQERRTA